MLKLAGQVYEGLSKEDLEDSERIALDRLGQFMLKIKIIMTSIFWGRDVFGLCPSICGKAMLFRLSLFPDSRLYRRLRY